MTSTPPMPQDEVVEERLCIHCGSRYGRSGSTACESNLLCVACRETLSNQQQNDDIVGYANVVLVEFPGRSIADGQQIGDPWPPGFPILGETTEDP
jgi:hypothetical protein